MKNKEAKIDIRGFHSVNERFLNSEKNLNNY